MPADAPFGAWHKHCVRTFKNRWVQGGGFGRCSLDATRLSSCLLDPSGPQTNGSPRCLQTRFSATVFQQLNRVVFCQFKRPPASRSCKRAVYRFSTSVVGISPYVVHFNSKTRSGTSIPRVPVIQSAICADRHKSKKRAGTHANLTLCSGHSQ